MRFQRKKLLLGALLLLIVVVGAVGLLNRSGGSPNYVSTQTEEGAENSTSSTQGTPLTTHTSGLIGSVVSTRNLSGLLVQVNQIDICTAPEVTAYVSLTNEQDEVFSGLNSNEVSVRVDGQVIDDFVLSTVRSEDLPLNSVLALDRSGSMRGGALSELKKAATSYIKNAEASDSMGAIAFNTSVQRLSNNSTNQDSLVSAINKLEADGETALFDAVAEAAKLTQECGRRAVLLMTDGEDTASRLSAQQAINAGNTKNVPVFVIGLDGDDFQPQVAENIAVATGAQYFQTPDPTQLSEIYTKIDQQLGGQYLVRFQLNLEKTNQERRLEIIIGEGDNQTKSVRSFVY